MNVPKKFPPGRENNWNRTKAACVQCTGAVFMVRKCCFFGFLLLTIGLTLLASCFIASILLRILIGVVAIGLGLAIYFG